MICLEGICLRKWFDSCSSLPLLNPFCRALSSTEVSTALRPFYFSVHPDLFGQFPEERTVNENSLKQLSSYIEMVQQNRTATPLTLKFYLRPHRSTNRVQSVKLLKSVNIQLRERNLRKIVLSILKTCDLPTTYVEQIAPETELKGKGKFFTEKDLMDFYENLSAQEAEFYENDPLTSDFIKRIRKKAKEEGHLKEWLERNHVTAGEYLKAYEPIRNEIEKLRKELCEKLGLRKIKWECGWNISHFRGSLQSFSALMQHHPKEMASLSDDFKRKIQILIYWPFNGIENYPDMLLSSAVAQENVMKKMQDVLIRQIYSKRKTLIFGNDTGVNLDGDVMLNCGEVRHNWLDVIKNVHLQDRVLLKLPQFEKAVSRVLRDIKVVHRKFQPKVMAEKYENQLRRLITSLSDHQGRYGYPKHWPEKLDEFELVVETEAGPLMLSPTGQLIVPSSCPAFLLVNFISDNLEEARKLLREYKSNKYVEKDLHRKVVLEFQLLNLRKDDNITPSLMIACCNKLLEHKEILRPLLKNSSLFITSYYSLLSDGQICIPWNWVI